MSQLVICVDVIPADGDAIAALVDSAPATLDTLNELAAALGDDPNFATTVSTSIGLKWTQDNTKISNWDTSFGWGNHASAGYIKPNGGTYTTASNKWAVIKNTGAGVGDYSEFQISNNADNYLVMGSIGSNFTDTAWAGSSYVYSDRELRLKANGEFKIYSGGYANSNIALTFSTDRNATFTGNVAAPSGTISGKLNVTKAGKTAYGLEIKGGFYGAPRLQVYDLAVDGNAYLGLGTDMSGAPYELSNYFPRYSGMGRWSVGSWAGDFGTGQYVSGYNEKMYITESASGISTRLNVLGDVGIGFSEVPAARLEIKGIDSTSSTDTSLFIKGGNSDGFYNNNQILFGFANSRNYAHAIKTRHQSNSVSGNAFDIYTWKYGDASSTPAGQHVMTIQGNGVGIGNTNPTAKLTITDEDGGESQLQVRNYATSATGSFTGNYMVELRSAYAPGSTGGALLVHTQESSDARPTMQVSSTAGVFATFVNGKVGIGTNLPAYKLHVLDSANFGTIAIGNITYPTLLTSNAVTGEFRIDNRSSAGAGYITFYPNGQAGTVGSEAVRISTNGNVGINTTSPQQKLDVQGSVVIGDYTSTNNVYMYDGYVDGSSSYYQIPRVNIGLSSAAAGGVDEAPVHLFLHNNNGTDGSWVKLSMGGRETTAGGNSVSWAGIAAKKTSGTSGSWASGDLYLWTKSSSTPVVNMVMKPSGNVGIGTDSPQAPLHIIAASTDNDALIQEWSYDTDALDRYSLMLKQTVTSGVVRYNFSMVNNNTAYNDVIVLDRGNVGIGTTSPSQKLQVAGNIYSTGYVQGGLATTSGYGGYAMFGSNSSSTPLAFGLDGGQYNMVINTSGLVGINTTSPQARLDVRSAGDTVGTSALLVSAGNSATNFNSNQIRLAYSGTGNFSHAIKTRHHDGNYLNAIDFYVWKYGTDSAGSVGTQHVMTLIQGGDASADTGRVGIGTTAPAYKLDVSGQARFTDGAHIQNGINLRRDLGAHSGISFYTPSYYNWQIYMSPAGATGAGANANLTAPSGLGTVTSWALRSRMEGVSTYGWLWETGGGSAGGATADVKMELGAETGTLRLVGDVIAYASDQRLKTNVKPIEDAVSKIKQISGVTYDWVDNITDEYGFYPTTMHEAGVLAQEIQKVLPEAVMTAPMNAPYTEKTGEDHNFLTVKYERIVPLLIEAIKELSNKVEELENKLNGNN